MPNPIGTLHLLIFLFVAQDADRVFDDGGNDLVGIGPTISTTLL